MDKLTNKKSIIKYLDENGISNYDINEFLVVDVFDNVTLTIKTWGNIPIQFGYVDGDFRCIGLTLTTLKGSPEVVNGDFYCSSNALTDLVGSPRKVNQVFDCSYCCLTTLQGAPDEVGSFYVNHNKLRSLKYSPQHVKDVFMCNSNELESLYGSPEIVYNVFSCSFNMLTTLRGCPKEIHGEFNCRNNKIDIFDCDIKGVKRINCEYNTIKEFKRIPKCEILYLNTVQTKKNIYRLFDVGYDLESLKFVGNISNDLYAWYREYTINKIIE